jgi:protein-tyrosine-phosphatase
MNILFVCTGNICRSPMAEGIMKKSLWMAKMKNVAVSSAGTLALDGNKATKEAFMASRDQGVDLSEHRARMIDKEMVERSDMICVMGLEQREAILEEFPEAEKKICFLGKFIDGSEGREEIQDPYGNSIYHYRLCFSEISMAVKGLIDFLQRQKKRSFSKS